MIAAHRRTPAAWSRDGSQIAVAVSENDAAGYRRSGIVLVDALNGSEQRLLEPAFDDIHSIGWSGDQTIAFVGTHPNESQSQVWSVDLRSRVFKRITNDLQNYIWLSAGRRGRLLTIQKNESSGIRAADFSESAVALDSRELLHEPDILAVAFGPDNSVYYTSRMSGAREIWRVKSETGESVRITVGANVVKSFSVSPRDGSLAYTSHRDGNNSIWLCDSKGKNTRRLTDGADFYPQFTPDGSTIVFQRSDHYPPTIWRV